MRAAVLIAMLLAPAAAAAQDPPAPSRTKDVVLLLSGAAAGLGIHEGGHVLAGVSFGARPSLKRINFGPIPFFAIDHQPVTRRREFVISSAGFWVQHAGSEWILTRHPDIRHERRPFLKGVLIFNLATSTLYSVTAFGGIGPEERDTHGMAVSLGRDGVHESAVGMLVLAPALLDGYRVFYPKQAWAKWASRAMKIAAVGLTLGAGR